MNRIFRREPTLLAGITLLALAAALNAILVDGFAAPLALAVDVPIKGSIEAAGRTAAHIGRIVEQYGITTLPESIGPAEPAAG